MNALRIHMTHPNYQPKHVMQVIIVRQVLPILFLVIMVVHALL